MNVETLEQRQLLTNPAVTNVTVGFTANVEIFPYGLNTIANGTRVTGVNVFDPDVAPNNYTPGNLQITAGNTDVNGNGNPAFRVAVVGGVDTIQVNDTRDLYLYSGVTTFTLTVVATDNGGAQGTGVVTINLLTPTNQRPVIPQYPYPGIDNLPAGNVNVLQVKENSFAGTVVGTVTAIDPDAGDQNTLTYAFVGTVPGFNASTPAFAIDPFTGKITVKDPSFLDYEARRQNTSSVVGDLGEGGLSGFADVVFDCQVSATDNRGLLSLTSRTDQDNNAGTTGDIAASHVYIRLRDVGETPPNVANSTKSLSVNENSPKNLSVGFFELNAGTPNYVNGPPRTSRAGLDPTEPQQTHSFAIVGGNPNNTFAIDYTTGEITVNNPVINYETLNVYDLQIAVTDENSAAVALGAVDNVAPLTTVATIHINVNDINEVTTIPDGQKFSIPENSVNGVIVGTVLANDPDTQKPNGQAVLKYSIISGNVVTVGGVNYANVFAIDPNTGTITVNNTTGLPQNVALNFENQPNFILTVQVIDRGDVSTSANNTITINLVNVNETPPSFSDYNFSIDENRPLSTLVGQVTAAVGEIGNSIVSYTILTGNTGNAFAIDNVGRITVNNPAMINFETNPQYVLTVKATDNGSPALFTTANITINLNNLNEQIAMLDQSFTCNENTPNGTIIGQIVTTDPDNIVTKTQGTLFSINGGNTGGAFSIDDQGRIIVTNSAALNYEVTPLFSIVTTVNDTGASAVPSTSVAATMTINLTNVNDAPFIGNQSFNLREHSLAGTVVGTVQATDEDRPAQTLTFAIIGGDPTGAFVIDPATGAITVTDPGLIDYLTTPTFNLTVQVTDNGVPALSSSATVSVNLLDVQDPQIPDQTMTIPENTANGIPVATVIASHGVAPYTYSIIGGNVKNAFVIDPATGIITVNNVLALDYEAIKSFAVKVLVTDSQSTPLGDTATITVNLTNVNEAPSLISLESTGLNYVEKSTNAVTSTIVATDPDSNNAQGAVIQLTTNYVSGEDVLVYTKVPKTSITGLFDPATGTMTLSGVDSLSNYRAAIRAVSYRNLSSNPSPLPRTITFQITDDGGLPSPKVSRTINVIPVNDPPVLDSTLNSLAYTEGDGVVAINPLTTVNDPDSLTLVGATITLTTFVSGEDVLGFVSKPGTGNIAVQSNVGGVLQLVSAGGTATLSQWQNALASVTYTNTSQNPTTTSRTVKFVADDGASANNISNTLTTTISITAVDNSPVLSNPSNVFFTESGSPIAIDAGIVVNDSDTTTFPSGVVTVANFVSGQDQISFTNDGLTMGDISVLSNVNGQLSLVSASGTATGSQWQAALASVTFANNSLNPDTTPRTVTFVLNDGTSNSNALVCTVNVIAVNNPPVLSGIETAVLQYFENTPPNFSSNNTTQISATITAADPDSLLTSAKIQITANYVAGEDFLRFKDTAKIKGSFDGTTGTLTLTGSATVANYVAALRSVGFFDRSENPTTLTRTVSFTVTDDGGASGTPKLNSNTVTRNIAVNAVNDPPTLFNTLDTAPLIYTEDGLPLPILPNFAVTDADSNNLSSATVKISSGYNDNGSLDRLVFTNTAKITGSWDATTGVLTLTGLDSLSNYRSALRTVAFANQNDAVNSQPRVVTFLAVDDTGVAGNPVARDIAITTHPNGAILSGIETTTKVFKANDPTTPPTPVTSSLVLNDNDSLNQTSAVVAISNNYVRNEDLLVIDNAVLAANRLTAAWNSVNGQLTLSGLASPSNYQNALQAVKYVNSSATPSTATRTISFQTFDDTPGTPLPSNIVTRLVSISTTNIASVVATNAAGALQYVEKDPATVIAPGMTVTDVDSPNLTGASIRITANYAAPQDQLVFANTATIKGSFDATSGTLTLSGIDSITNYQAALRTVQYVNTSNNPSGLTRTVGFSVNDGLTNSNTATRSITVTPVNDGPAVALNRGDLTYSSASSGIVVLAPAFTVTDPDSDFATTAKIQISSNYERGKDTLTFVTIGKISGVFDVASGTLTLTGTDTFSNYRAAIQSIKYQYTGNTVPSSKIVQFSVSDGIAFGNTASLKMNLTP